MPNETARRAVALETHSEPIPPASAWSAPAAGATRSDIGIVVMEGVDAAVPPIGARYVPFCLLDVEATLNGAPWREFWAWYGPALQRRTETASVDSAPPDDAGQCLLRQVGMALDAEPLEAGMDHRAESVLAEALEGSAPPGMLDAVRDCCLSDDGRVAAADLLRCLARLSEPGTDRWRTDLIRDALKTGAVEVRDAALEAAEAWKSRSMLDVLRSHADPDPELRGEISEIVGEWEG